MIFKQYAEPKTDSKADVKAQTTSNSSNSTSNQKGFKDPLKIVKEGWLRLASQQFQDSEKYPDLPLSDNKISKVEVLFGQITQQNTIQSTGIRNQGEVFFRRNKNFGIDKDIPTVDSFYFRISGLNAYYTETNDDMIVLGAIQISNIQTTQISNINSEQCFTIENSEYDKWNLCAKNTTERQEWICSIQQVLGVPCGSTNQTKTVEQNITVKEVSIKKQNILLIPEASPYCNENWNYMNAGSDWVCKCSEGKQQSPIKLDGFKNPLYNDAEFLFNNVNINLITLEYKENGLRMYTTEKKGFGTLVDYELNEYLAKEIRFHTPAEHQLSIKKSDMEIQVIYEPVGETSMQEKAILSFIINQKAGATNYFLDILDPLELPNQINVKRRIHQNQQNQGQQRKTINLLDIFREDVEDSIQEKFNYYYYMGSLTAPPCVENVKWFIVDEEINFGYTSLEMIKQILQPPTSSETQELSSQLQANFQNLNPNGNNRVIQNLNNRDLYYYDKTKDKCHEYKQKEKKKNKLNGHYEKVETKSFTYLYVPGQSLSGIKNSVNVTQDEAIGNDELLAKEKQIDLKLQQYNLKK